MSLCQSVCLSVPSFLRQIFILGAGILKACPGVRWYIEIINSPVCGIVGGAHMVFRHKLRNGVAEEE